MGFIGCLLNSCPDFKINWASCLSILSKFSTKTNGKIRAVLIHPNWALFKKQVD